MAACQQHQNDWNMMFLKAADWMTLIKFVAAEYWRKKKNLERSNFPISTLQNEEFEASKRRILNNWIFRFQRFKTILVEFQALLSIRSCKSPIFGLCCRHSLGWNWRPVSWNENITKSVEIGIWQVRYSLKFSYNFILLEINLFNNHLEIFCF